MREFLYASFKKPAKYHRITIYRAPGLKKRSNVVAALPGRQLKCSNFPGRKTGKEEKEIREKKGKIKKGEKGFGIE